METGGNGSTGDDGSCREGYRRTHAHVQMIYDAMRLPVEGGTKVEQRLAGTLAGRQALAQAATMLMAASSSTRVRAGKISARSRNQSTIIEPTFRFTNLLAVVNGAPLFGT